MSTALTGRPQTGHPQTAVFGRGGGEPFDQAIRSGGGQVMLVPRADGGHRRQHDARATVLDVSAYLAPATAAERRTLDASTGPVLDVGCGPGRIVRAAIDAGRLALGIDVSAAAIAHATADGLPVLRRSVFDRLPAEGSWGAVSLFDGNIGIEGAPDALLERCAELLAPGGSLLVETHTDHDRDHRFEATLRHPSGRESDAFPWAEAGALTVLALTEALGMSATTVRHGARTFVVATR